MVPSTTAALSLVRGHIGALVVQVPLCPNDSTARDRAKITPSKQAWGVFTGRLVLMLIASLVLVAWRAPAPDAAACLYARAIVPERTVPSLPLALTVRVVLFVNSNVTSPLSRGVTELPGVNPKAPFTSSL